MDGGGQGWTGARHDVVLSQPAPTLRELPPPLRRVVAQALVVNDVNGGGGGGARHGVAAVRASLGAGV